MYVMKCQRADGREYETKAEIAEYEEATESRLALYAIREALGRMNYACEITIHTECGYVAAAIRQGWLRAWERKNWKNSRGEEVKDSILWSQIYQETEENGHILKAEVGRHEYSDLMRYRMRKAYADQNVFGEIPEW